MEWIIGTEPAESVSSAHYLHPTPWDVEFPPLSVPQLLADQVALRPDAPMVDFLGRQYSYHEVQTGARRFAAGLQAQGFGKGDRVGVFLPNVPAYAMTYYGAMMAGATLVNFSPLYTADELEAQVEDSGTRLLVTLDVPSLLPTALKVLDNSSLTTLVVARLADQMSFWKGLALRLFGHGQITAVPSRPDCRSWAASLGGDEVTPVEIDPLNDIALLQYTGGTTGTPKGAMLTHQNLTANARQLCAVDPDRGDRDVVLGVLPLFHVFANTCVLNRTVVNGGCVVMLPRFEAGQTLASIERTRPTSLFAVPTMYQALLDHPRVSTTNFSSIRQTISGGAPLPLPLKARFEQVTGVRVIEGYGLTESSGVVSTNPLVKEARDGTIGQPIPGTCVRLLDKEDPERDAEPGEPGELAVRGPQIMAGYWNRPDAAAHAFAQRDGKKWLRTGDIATFDADGFVRIVDRSKDMIAVGGFKVFPSRVEKQLLEHPDVDDVLVIGLPDEYLGEKPHAFVTLKPGHAGITGDELREWLNPRLGKHERVGSVAIRADFPKTSIGKPDRKALKEEVAG